MRVACAIAVLAFLMAGCLEGGPHCGFGLKPKVPEDGRRGVAPAESTLRDHPDFAALVQRPDRDEGVGRAVACDEGIEVMDELEAQGAQVRRFGGPARDTFILLDNRSYHLNLGVAQD